MKGKYIIECLIKRLKKLTKLKPMSAERKRRMIHHYYYNADNVTILNELVSLEDFGKHANEIREALICDKIFSKATYMLEDEVKKNV